MTTVCTSVQTLSKAQHRLRRTQLLWLLQPSVDDEAVENRGLEGVSGEMVREYNRIAENASVSTRNVKLWTILRDSAEMFTEDGVHFHTSTLLRVAQVVINL